MNKGKSSEAIEEIFKQIIRLYSAEAENHTEELKRVIEMIWLSDAEKVIKSRVELFPNGKPTEREFLSVLERAANDCH